jgi:7-cyano-7-deazaguanine synthase
MHCQRLGIKHLIIPLDFMHKYFKSALLESADAIPDGNYDDENMKSTVVPFRNGIMLAIACGIAESNGLKRVMIANHAGDHSIYPDCRSPFIEAMSTAMMTGTYEGVKVYAPYTDLSKTEIARHGAALGLDYSETYSCYKGGEKHCGTCGTCTERRQALRDAGIDDPTEYLV